MILLKKCNAPGASLSLALVAALTILSPVGAANRITDTTGYATLAATDAGGTYSLVPNENKKNWNWNGEMIAVRSGIDFLVQNGYTVRSYGTTGAGITFSGDSLTLDNCMVKLSMPNTNQVYVIPLLYLYNANINIAQANGGALSQQPGITGVAGPAVQPLHRAGEQAQRFAVRRTVEAPQRRAQKVGRLGVEGFQPFEPGRAGRQIGEIAPDPAEQPRFIPADDAAAPGGVGDVERRAPVPAQERALRQHGQRGLPELERKAIHGA